MVDFQPKFSDAGMRDLEERTKLLLNAPYPERLVATKDEFMKQLLTKKRKLDRAESVALTVESSSYLIHTALQKLADPGSFSIPCQIGTFSLDKALCDLGASVIVIQLSLAKRLGLTEFACTSMTVQMADLSAVQAIGVLEDISVQIEKFFFPVDFVVLDIYEDRQTPIILGRPILHTAGAVSDVGLRTLTFKVGKERISFAQSPIRRDPMMVQ
ncbi:uncharacterized protein LOC141632028 [Silene latifolia]|uniref:uncharacterized protein LOC141632028 n=1 Tax=Silene latifolia TaxID=37657 RepID=UPI003D776187